MTVGALALLVATMGFRLNDGKTAGVRVEFGYGSNVGFAAAALLVALAIVPVRPLRGLVVLVPIAICIAYIVVVTLPLWDVLPRGAQSTLRFADPSWLTVAGLLIALRLMRSWLGPPSSRLFVLLPVAMLALAAVSLVAMRDEGIAWGGGLIVGFCLLLTLLGAIEGRVGLENLRVPEILRVDRL